MNNKEITITNTERLIEIFWSACVVTCLTVCLWDIWPQTFYEWLKRFVGVFPLTIAIVMELKSVYYCDEDILLRKLKRLEIEKETKDE